MGRSLLVYINLGLLAALSVAYTRPETQAEPDRLHTVFISTAVPDSTEATRVSEAATAIESDWNGRVTVLFSGEAPGDLAGTLKRAISLDPGGISLPGSPNDHLILPFVTEAQRQGIRTTFHSVPMPEAESRFDAAGAGYVGPRGDGGGRQFAATAVKRFNLGPRSRVVLVGTTEAIEPGTRLHACQEYLAGDGITPEYHRLEPAAAAGGSLPDVTLINLLQEVPLPAAIFWDAGPVGQVTVQLDNIGADPSVVSVVSFVPLDAPLPTAESQFVKMQVFEDPFLTCYLSLVQLHLSERYGLPGIDVPMGEL